jgi:RNA polymerase sigma-70 factor (ECF subfamily)
VPARPDDAALEPHIPAMRRFAWSLVREQDRADDLVQEALLKALSSWAQLRRAESLKPWLFQILYNVFRTDCARRARHPHALPAVDDPDHPSVAFEPTDRIHALDAVRAMARLSAEQRSVIELVAIEGLAYEEAARVLGVPIGTVMSRLSRARERLRELIEAPQAFRLRRVK